MTQSRKPKRTITASQVDKLIAGESALVKTIVNSHDNNNWYFTLQQFRYPEIFRPIKLLSPFADRTLVVDTLSPKLEFKRRPIEGVRGRYKVTRFSKETNTTLLPHDGVITLYTLEQDPIGIGLNLKDCRFIGERTREALHLPQDADTTTLAKRAFRVNATTNEKWHIYGQSFTRYQAVPIKQIQNQNRLARKKGQVLLWNDISARISENAHHFVFAINTGTAGRLNALQKNI